jgi:hypothetical protein
MQRSNMHVRSDRGAKVQRSHDEIIKVEHCSNMHGSSMKSAKVK